MFVVLLRFADNQSQAGKHLAGHREWVQRGFDDGVFLLAGSLEPDAGGTVLAHNTSRTDLQARLDDDPFVSAGVVRPQILEVTPARADERLQFLLAGASS